MEDAITRIKFCENWKTENNMRDIRPEDIQREFNWGALLVKGHDKAGRPLVFQRPAKYWPD